MTPSQTKPTAAQGVDRINSEKFARLVRDHIDLVYAAARRQVTDPATADDVTQAVFILLLKKMPSLAHDALLPGWLVRAAHFCAADANRQRLRRERHEREAAAMKSSYEPSDPDQNEILRHVDDALAGLGSKDRTAIAMRYLQQRPLRDVAAALGIKEEAAKKRIARALSRLRGRLSPLRGAVTASAIGVALEQAASVTAPPALAASITNAAIAGGAIAPGVAGTLVSLKLIGIAVAVALLLLPILILIRQYRSSPAQTVSANVAPAPMSAPIAKLYPMPAPSSLTPQQRRIYELVYDLRNEVPPSRPEEWIATLREITQIGSPAVPALCVELDRTSKDGTQRLLIMALRIIGDARAVPTLINAIPRVAGASSDYSFKVSDLGLRGFLDSHYWEGADKIAHGDYPDDCYFNRGITECVAALEAITHHSEGQQPIMDLPAPAVMRQRRQAFAVRWQRWWDQHQSELVTAAALATVDAARYDGDSVAAIGETTGNQLFPTGADVQLSPVNQVDISVQGLADSPAYFSFETQQLFCVNEDREDLDQGNYSQWFHDRNIDIQATVYGTGGKGAYRWYAALDCNDMKTWAIENNRFDTIEDEVRQSAPLDLGRVGPHAGFGPYDLTTGVPLQRASARYPATFLFQTRANRFGILQIVGGVNDETAVRIRYRLWPLRAVHAEPSSLPSGEAGNLIPAGSTFGEVHELVLAPAKGGQPSALNLKTGQTKAQEVDVDQPAFTDAKKSWAKKESVDLLTCTTPDGKLVGLVSAGPLLAGVHDSAWSEMSAQTCAAIADRARRYQSAHQASFAAPTKPPAFPAGSSSSTWVVISEATGTVGLLQITDVQPTSLRLRYKLIVPSNGTRQARSGD
jgi:RNA polymerase sigma factor (sigma-70 family)